MEKLLIGAAGEGPGPGGPRCRTWRSRSKARRTT